jgi:hypothetical protein
MKVVAFLVRAGKRWNDIVLGFLFHKKRDEVQRILHGRVNRAHARSIAVENFRGATRGIYTEVIWVIPCRSASRVDYSSVIPAVSKDLSSQGISFVHNRPITEPRAIVGLKDETGPRFLLCTMKHCTDLGYGFYHIGLIADEVHAVDQDDCDLMQRVLEEFESTAKARESSGAAALV